MSESGILAVYLQERSKLARLLVARLGSAEEAEDILQELWLKLNGTPLGPISEPAAYLFRMANNLAIDRRRSAAWRAVREAEWVETQPAASELPDTTDVMIARERLAHVQAAIAAMPEREARAFRMFRLEGKPQKVIAAEMGVSLSLVEKLLQNAYRRIHDAGRENDAGRRAPPRLFSKEDRT
ncbi:sigma-70 family RNA polymerase sigma factor [Sphingomonas sp. AP4-R1]|uniref:RNA polymerase sigma factor n=1 Tax=Sphingomonas sp. AP4-R1 TaxID=2735134 RepID=UPI00149344C3|nr:sigma-70 family RNA polymerase sigma factor [Sphingomonas sp. AP4-R1]QJU60339.1 sigma-70 family RNA polymerase sigma factor [Sphingomonas sp. AP4-R1]